MDLHHGLIQNIEAFQIKRHFFLGVVLANSVESDKMPHYVAFHMGLHSLPNHARFPGVMIII